MFDLLKFNNNKVYLKNFQNGLQHLAGVIRGSEWWVGRGWGGGPLVG